MENSRNNLSTIQVMWEDDVMRKEEESQNTTSFILGLDESNSNSKLSPIHIASFLIFLHLLDTGDVT